MSPADQLRSLAKDATAIHEFSPDYFVTDMGEIYCVREHWSWPSPRRVIAHLHRTRDGRLRIHYFTRAGKRKRAFVHKLVAVAFLPPKPSSKHEIRHLDGDPTNNRVSNLAWGTHLENVVDRETHGRTARGSKNGAARLNEAQVSEIKQKLQEKRTQVSLAVEYGVALITIRRISSEETWGHIA